MEREREGGGRVDGAEKWVEGGRTVLAVVEVEEAEGGHAHRVAFSISNSRVEAPAWGTAQACCCGSQPTSPGTD